MAKAKSKTEDGRFRVELSRTDLLRALALTEPVCGRRQTIPMLSYVELTAGFGTLGVTCNNLDLEVRAEIEATGEGAACLPAHRLLQILRAMPKHVERIVLASDGQGNGTVTLTAPDIEASFGTLPATDFPQMTLERQAWSLALPDGVFRYLIGGAAPVMSDEETRYYLNGVCLEVREGEAIAAATDGHRLVSRTVALAGEPITIAPVIIPRDAVRLLLPRVGGAEVRLTGYRKGNAERVGLLELTGNGLRARLKTIDGTFPNWRRVVPTADGTVLSFEVGDLSAALGMAKANSHERGRAVAIEAANGGIRLVSRSPDTGDLRTRLSAEVSADFGEFGVNIDYAQGLVRQIADLGSKRINLHVTGPGEPIRIMPDAAIAGATAVLMPMRI